MPVDAHIHFRDLHELDPDFAARFAASGIEACAASHSPADFAWTESLRSQGLVFAASLGIHPQSPGMGHADFLEKAAQAGRVDLIGEAGFDLFGDEPGRERNEANIAVQREAFEFQLELAIDLGLPLLLHVRKALDLVFPYAKRLARLPAALFHSWPGTPGEAEALLAKGLPVYFSFGASILNGHKKALASLAALPEDRILSETDAPWQPPKGSPFCRFEDIHRVLAAMAALRGRPVGAMEEAIAANWARLRGGEA